MDNLTREELQDIRARAEIQAGCPGLSKCAQAALYQLMVAADTVDAQMAREELNNTRPHR
jgi:hypothetical protein